MNLKSKSSDFDLRIQMWLIRRVTELWLHTINILLFGIYLVNLNCNFSFHYQLVSSLNKWNICVLSSIRYSTTAKNLKWTHHIWTSDHSIYRNCNIVYAIVWSLLLLSFIFFYYISPNTGPLYFLYSRITIGKVSFNWWT